MKTEYEAIATQKMKNAVLAAHKNFAKVSTGRPNPSMLDALRINAYGSSDMRIDQLATVVTEDRTLVINVWDASTITAIEKAIVKSNLGLNPSSTDTTIRILIPPLTEETRLAYSKQVKEEAEQAKIAIRNARRDANSSIKIAQKNTEISENEATILQQAIEKLTRAYITKIDEMYQKKHQELMTI